jgi:hypothetical protein
VFDDFKKCAGHMIHFKRRMFVDLIEGSIIVIKVEVSLEHGRSLRSILILCKGQN